MDDTRTLSLEFTGYFDFTDDIERPHLDDACQNTSPAGSVDEVDALADARGVVRGLAMALAGWALVVLAAMLAM